MHKVIANTTPMIALAEIGQLELLHKVYGEILIPESVLKEIISEPARTEVTNSSWIRVGVIRDVMQRQMYRARLHAGEVDVMILAQQENADLVIIDDNAAKKTAKFLGLKVTGTLGVIIRAKKEGYIKNIRPLLEEIADNGFYIDEKTRQYALQAAGELPNGR